MDILKKTNVYNVVILDQSGSMFDIKREAINGYNETLQTIQAAQRKHAGTQDHFVTLVVFNSVSVRTVYDRIACGQAVELSDNTYRPQAGTPLFDAMGATLSKLRDMLDAENGYNVLVTIITDGMENDSKEYGIVHINRLVSELTELGWMITYIGANHDVKAFSQSISIPNALSFVSSERGTRDMFAKVRTCRTSHYERIANSLGKKLTSDFFE